MSCQFHSLYIVAFICNFKKLTSYAVRAPLQIGGQFKAHYWTVQGLKIITISFSSFKEVAAAKYKLRNQESKITCCVLLCFAFDPEAGSLFRNLVPCYFYRDRESKKSP